MVGGMSDSISRKLMHRLLINGTIEESLNLTGMQIHRLLRAMNTRYGSDDVTHNNVIAATLLDHVGH
jgi:hypothetical protein